PVLHPSVSTSHALPLPSVTSAFFPHGPRAPPALHSFPTRRSSDLRFGVRRRRTARRTAAGRSGFSVAGEEAAGPRPSIGVTVISDRKSTRLNSSHVSISYAVFCLKKKK